MHLITILSVLIPVTNAYPLGRSSHIHLVELSQNDFAGIALRSPFPAFRPDAAEDTLHRSLRDVTPPSSLTSRDFATSFVTTLLGGGLALYFT